MLVKHRNKLDAAQTAMEETQTQIDAEKANAKETKTQIDELFSCRALWERGRWNQASDRRQVDRTCGRQYRIQRAHQVQDFTEPVHRSGVNLVGDFFAGISGYITNNHFQKTMLCGTLIVAETWPLICTVNMD